MTAEDRGEAATPEREAIRALIDAMEMQEGREAGEFHISQPVARGIWDDAKAKGYAVLNAAPAA